MSKQINRQAIMKLAEEPTVKRGYSIDRLRYKMALTSLQRDFCKEKLINTCHSTMNNAPWSRKSGGAGAGGFASPVLGTLLKGLSYADYVMLGFSIFKTSKNVFSFFKKKKK